MKRILPILTLLTLLVPLLSFAEPFRPSPPASFPQPDTTLNPEALTEPNDIIDFISTIANWIFTVLIVVAVIFILLAAFQYLTSKGGEEVKKAHKMIAYAAIALAIGVLARGIVFSVRVLVDSSTPAETIFYHYENIV